MPSWKKIIVSGSNAELASVTASYLGTGSSVTNLTLLNTTSYNYSTGLFTTFGNTTAVADAVKQINDVLKGVAPQPAPDLTQLADNNSSTNGTVAFTGYSSATTAQTTYRVKSGQTLGGQVSRAELGTLSSTPYYNNLGTFWTAQSLTIPFNPITPADGVNYSNQAFKVRTSNVTDERYTVELNGSTFINNVTPNTFGAYNVGGLSLSATQSGQFSSGTPFTAFASRTGTITIGTSDWAPGYNYVVVSQSLDNGSSWNITNIVEWYNDQPTGSNANASFALSVQTGSAFYTNTSTELNLSGVSYLVTPTLNVPVTCSNFYANVYQKTLNAIASANGIGGLNTPTIPDPTSPRDNLQTIFAGTVNRNSIGTGSLGTTLIAPNPSFTVRNNPVKTAATIAAISQVPILASIQSAVNTTNVETFYGETYRLLRTALPDVQAGALPYSDTWNNGADYTSVGIGGVWDSTTAIGSNGQDAVIVPGRLIHGRLLGNTGDGRVGGTYKPNYAFGSPSQYATYIRAFRNNDLNAAQYFDVSFTTNAVATLTSGLPSAATEILGMMAVWDDTMLVWRVRTLGVNPQEPGKLVQGCTYGTDNTSVNALRNGTTTLRCSFQNASSGYIVVPSTKWVLIGLTVTNAFSVGISNITVTRRD
jgi:hypothetical protein